jgi:hypothetical protein
MKRWFHVVPASVPTRAFVAPCTPVPLACTSLLLPRRLLVAPLKRGRLLRRPPRNPEVRHACPAVLRCPHLHPQLRRLRRGDARRRRDRPRARLRARRLLHAHRVDRSAQRVHEEREAPPPLRARDPRARRPPHGRAALAAPLRRARRHRRRHQGGAVDPSRTSSRSRTSRPTAASSTCSSPTARRSRPARSP